MTHFVITAGRRVMTSHIAAPGEPYGWTPYSYWPAEYPYLPLRLNATVDSSTGPAQIYRTPSMRWRWSLVTRELLDNAIRPSAYDLVTGAVVGYSGHVDQIIRALIRKGLGGGYGGRWAGTGNPSPADHGFAAPIVVIAEVDSLIAFPYKVTQSGPYHLEQVMVSEGAVRKTSRSVAVEDLVTDLEDAYNTANVAEEAYREAKLGRVEVTPAELKALHDTARSTTKAFGVLAAGYSFAAQAELLDWLTTNLPAS